MEGLCIMQAGAEGGKESAAVGREKKQTNKKNVSKKEVWKKIKQRCSSRHRNTSVQASNAARGFPLFLFFQIVG